MLNISTPKLREQQQYPYYIQRQTLLPRDLPTRFSVYNWLRSKIVNK